MKKIKNLEGTVIGVVVKMVEEENFEAHGVNNDG